VESPPAVPLLIVPAWYRFVVAAEGLPGADVAASHCAGRGERRLTSPRSTCPNTSRLRSASRRRMSSAGRC